MLEELKGKNVRITAGSGAAYADISVYGVVLDVDSTCIKIKSKDSVQYVVLNATIRIEVSDKDA